MDKSFVFGNLDLQLGLTKLDFNNPLHLFPDECIFDKDIHKLAIQELVKQYFSKCASIEYKKQIVLRLQFFWYNQTRKLSMPFIEPCQKDYTVESYLQLWHLT